MSDHQKLRAPPLSVPEVIELGIYAGTAAHEDEEISRRGETLRRREGSSLVLCGEEVLSRSAETTADRFFEALNRVDDPKVKLRVLDEAWAHSIRGPDRKETAFTTRVAAAIEVVLRDFPNAIEGLLPRDRSEGNEAPVLTAARMRKNRFTIT